MCGKLKYLLLTVENLMKQEMLRCSGRKKMFTVMVLLCGYISSAQPLKDESPMKLQLKAEKFFDEGDYYNAFLYYENLVKIDSSNRSFHYYLGVSKLQLRAHRYEGLIDLYKSGPDVSPEWYYYTGKALHLSNHFEEAITMFRKYRFLSKEKEFTDDEIEFEINTSLAALQYIHAPNEVVVNNIGSVINTHFPEYAPLITSDGDKIFFTSRRPFGDMHVDQTGEYFEDIYMCTYTQGRGWSQPLRLPEPVNSNGHDACVGVSSDGTELFIYRANEQYKTGMLFVSTFADEKWNEPVMLDPEINSEEYLEQSACISPDKRTIYFSSDREGGMGGKDIYRLVRLPNGKWSDALNMGPSINTDKDEDSPYIHPEGNTLYFSSMGHKSMGGYDVYSTHQNDEGEWLPAENLGYPLNTADDDIHFVITGDRTTGYYSSARPGGEGETDVYKIYLDGEKHELLIQEGFVFDASDSTQAIHATITLIDMTDHKLSGIYSSHKNSGKYIVLLKPNHEYKLVIESSAYHTYSENVVFTTEAHAIYLSQKK
jgi:tetratricopeptide (TPR) repeat protein